MIDYSLDHIYDNISHLKNTNKSYLDQFKVYQTEIVALNLLCAGRPISGFTSNNEFEVEEYYISYRSDCKIYLFEIVYNNNSSISYNNLTYYKLRYVMGGTNSNTPNKKEYDSVKTRNNIVGCLFLPKLGETGFKNRTGDDTESFFYCTIKSDWSSRTLYAVGSDK
jgi:hypothetical protein